MGIAVTFDYSGIAVNHFILWCPLSAYTLLVKSAPLLRHGFDSCESCSCIFMLTKGRQESYSS